MTTDLREVSDPAMAPPAFATPPAATPADSTPTQAGEYLAGSRSVARAMRLGLFIWPSYTLLDVYMCFVAFPQARFWLFLLYRAVVELAFFSVYRASRDGKMQLDRLVFLQNATYVSAAFAISMMALELGGILSPYMHGISIVALVRTALVPTELRKGAKTYAGIAVAFPLVMAIDALVSPAARAALTSATLIAFVSHYVFVVTSAFLGLITGHIVWSAQEQLYRARRVGRYRLQAPIGKGGMGEVWLAWDESLHRNVALKMLRVGTTTTAAVRRFELEARAAGQLRGPHVVRIFDFGANEDGLYYIAMEYLVGMSVSSLLERFGPMPAARAINLGIQCCLALEEAHEAGIIHRDLKPHNLYITHTLNEPDFLKLLDFGIARLQTSGVPSERLTSLGLLIGTPAYLAPELWFANAADERSDIYAFGITLHAMLTGDTPFAGMSLADLRAAQLSGKPPDLKLRGTGPVTVRLESLLRRCLAWSPNDRIQTVRELREALINLHDPAQWTPADANEFWKAADKERFTQTA